MDDLFSHLPPPHAGGRSGPRRLIAPGAWVLPRRLLAADAQALAPHGWPQALQPIVQQAPWRHWLTPGGRQMSVQSTNCGAVGWVSDRAGYRYQSTDPDSHRPWPAMPLRWQEMAQTVAAEVGYHGFCPDACLINRYRPDARMTLHQDRDEVDFAQPIVSWSLGMAAVFLFGGMSRQDRPQRLVLEHGDVVVWGGPTRLVFHGIAPVKGPVHPSLGDCRVNLTFRCAV